MTDDRNQNQMLAVFDGRTCAGFVLSRGPAGFEAFDPHERSLGLFRTQQDAVVAIPERSQ